MNLSIRNVSKQYRRDVWGLRDFSLELGAGVLGLLGPNGAGKSTLMRILATVTDKTGGAVTWNGVDIANHPDNLRRVLGYLPQDFGVYPNLNALEFLEYMAAIKGLDAKSAKRRINELLHLVNLVDSARRPLGGYSGGMVQRVGIAQALLNDPRLLIVDEPTAGVLAEKCHPCRDQPLPPLGYPFGGPNATGLAPLRPIPLVQGLLNSPSEGDLQYLWPAELLLGVCIKQRVRTFSIESWRGERFGCILQRGHQMVAGKKLATD